MIVTSLSLLYHDEMINDHEMQDERDQRTCEGSPLVSQGGHGHHLLCPGEKRGEPQRKPVCLRPLRDQALNGGEGQEVGGEGENVFPGHW